jgi:organic radical activating enzyme
MTIDTPGLISAISMLPLVSNDTCSYCDTEYAFKGNNLLSIDAVLTEIKKYNTKFVCVTGGEPLAQINTIIPQKNQP